MLILKICCGIFLAEPIHLLLCTTTYIKEKFCGMQQILFFCICSVIYAYQNDVFNVYDLLACSKQVSEFLLYQVPKNKWNHDLHQFVCNLPPKNYNFKEMSASLCFTKHYYLRIFFLYLFNLKIKNLFEKKPHFVEQRNQHH